MRFGGLLALPLLAAAMEATAQQAYYDPNTVAWRELCDDTYFTGMGLPTPWKVENRVGLGLENTTCWDLSREWDVYHKSVSPTITALAKTGATGPQASVYFALYNRRVGVLRIFAYMNPAQDGYHYSMKLAIQNENGTRLQDHSLLAYDGGNDAHTVMERFDANKNAEKLYVLDRHVRHVWLIQDTYLSFDWIGAKAAPWYFDYLTYSNDVGNIKLNGTIGPQWDNTKGTGPMQTLMNIGSSVNAGFNKGQKGYDKTVDVMWDLGNKLNNAGGGKWLMDLTTQVAQINQAGPGIGLAWAGNNLIRGFLGWNGGGSIGMSPSVIALNGTLTFPRNVTNPRIPLANANFAEAERPMWAKTYNTGADKDLGLFVFHMAPEVKVTYVDAGRCNAIGGGRPLPIGTTRSYYVSIFDPTCGLYINPASGAKLKDIKAKVTVNIPRRTYSDRSSYATMVRINKTTDFLPSTMNRFLIGSRCMYGDFSSEKNITVHDLKIYTQLDVGRGEFMEVVNTYSPSKVTIANGEYPFNPENRDFGICGSPDFARIALEQESSDLWFRSEPTGTNWYTLFGLPNAVGSSAMVSGRTPDSYYDANTGTFKLGESRFTTNFRGSGLSFRWRVSSQPYYDYLAFFVDGVLQAAIWGNQDWSTQDFALPYGDHTVQWAYIKNGAYQWGEDRGMIDQLVIR